MKGATGVAGFSGETLTLLLGGQHLYQLAINRLLRIPATATSVRLIWQPSLSFRPAVHCTAPVGTLIASGTANQRFHLPH